MALTFLASISDSSGMKLFLKTAFIITIIITSQASTAADQGIAAHESAKTFDFLIQPIGLGPSHAGSTGLVVAYHLTASTMVLFEAVHHIYSVSYGEVSNQQYRTRAGSSMGVHIKQEVSGGLYGKVGIDRRIYDFTGTGSGGLMGFHSNTTALSIAVGSQWRFGYFTFGCDWLGYSFPLVTDYRDEAITSTGLQYDSDREKKSLGEPALQLLRIYLGASF